MSAGRGRKADERRNGEKRGSYHQKKERGRGWLLLVWAVKGWDDTLLKTVKEKRTF